MIEDRLYTTKELAKEFGVSTRTIHNRLKFLRIKYPDSYEIQRHHNGIPRFFYKGSCLNVDMLTKRSYPERREFNKTLTKAEREYIPPPKMVEDKNGNIYNYFSLKALMKVVTDSTLLEKFMALTMMLWLALCVYIWRV
jgi:hypothetical protein